MRRLTRRRRYGWGRKRQAKPAIHEEGARSQNPGARRAAWPDSAVPAIRTLSSGRPGSRLHSQNRVAEADLFSRTNDGIHGKPSWLLLRMSRSSSLPAKTVPFGREKSAPAPTFCMLWATQPGLERFAGDILLGLDTAHSLPRWCLNLLPPKRRVN